MTVLQRVALGRDVMTAEAVEAYYRKAKPAGNIVGAMVCESHERLRMELEGSAVLHQESADALRKAADDAEENQTRFLRVRKQLEHAVEAGLTHATKLAALRDGLLRIFARAPDWSGECVQANIADMLCMTVSQVQSEIDTEDNN